MPPKDVGIMAPIPIPGSNGETRRSIGTSYHPRSEVALKAIVKMSRCVRDWERSAQLAAESGAGEVGQPGVGRGPCRRGGGRRTTALPRLRPQSRPPNGSLDLGPRFTRRFSRLGRAGTGRNSVPCRQSSPQKAQTGYPIQSIGLQSLKPGLIEEVGAQNTRCSAQTELLVQSGRLALDGSDVAAAQSKATGYCGERPPPRMVAAAARLIDAIGQSKRTSAESSADAAIPGVAEEAVPVAGHRKSRVGPTYAAAS
jgi:hypothetical protein